MLTPTEQLLHVGMDIQSYFSGQSDSEYLTH